MPELTIIGDGGETLVLPVAVEPSEIERVELERWASLPSTDDDEVRDPASLSEAFTATALFVAVTHGIVGNLAYAMFPNAARYLAAHLTTRGKPLTGASMAERARQHAINLYGVPDDEAVVEEMEKQPSGTWKATVALQSGPKVKVSLSADGDIVKIRVKA
ncbi:MAG: hypothetical protein ACFCVK_10100 [Acidimicrobiales bacterium]